MKRYISYFAVLLAVLLGAACSKDDSAAGSDNRTGVMAMTVSTRQTADTGEYDPLQHQTVYIYNDEGGLLRKYTSKEACPERLELLAGTYRVAVEAGEVQPIPNGDMSGWSMTGRVVLEQRQQHHDKNALHLYRREIREVCTGCKTNQHQYAGIGRRQPVHRRIRL